MAKVTVKRETPVNPPIKSVTLELTPEEAEVVRELTGNVFGSGPARKIADSIFFALHDAGISGTPSRFNISGTSVRN